MQLIGGIVNWEALKNGKSLVLGSSRYRVVYFLFLFCLWLVVTSFFLKLDSATALPRGPCAHLQMSTFSLS